MLPGVRGIGVALVLAASSLVLAAAAGAQPTGKIAGVVTERATGEPLPGVNVTLPAIPGTGAATNTDGEYFILQVPPGTYTVLFSYIGFNTVTVEEVKVNSGLTTRLSIEMSEMTFEGEEVVITAEDPIVKRDVTSTRRSATREELDNTPGARSALDIFKLQGGTTVQAAAPPVTLETGTQLQVRDQSVKDVHVRGGRGGEILFMVDGMPVSHPLYGGRSVLELNVNDVDQVELLTGAFNAEYGQAQSGVVNITTRSGSEHMEAGLEYRTDQLGLIGESYNEDYATGYVGGPLRFTRALGLPGTFNYFLSGNATLTDTPFDNARTREDLDLGLGLGVPGRQDNTGSVNAKLDWRLNPSLRLALGYQGTWKKWSRFDWLWRDYPDHTADYARDNHNVSLHVNHTVSNRTFYNVRAGYLTVDYDASLNGRSPASFWSFQHYGDGDTTTYSHAEWRQAGGQRPDVVEPTVAPPTLSPLTYFFDDTGYETIWRDDLTRSYTLKADLSSQIHPRHFVKTGFLIQHHRLHYIDIQDGGITLSPYGKYVWRDGDEVARPPGPFPEFGQNRWVFRADPTEGGFYVQDKFELDALIINAGLRADWFLPGGSVFDEGWQAQWENATGLEADWSRLRYKISPRFGISFPISEEMVLFFSYGHFNQLPEMQFYYRDPYTGGLTGNPHLDYVQTILYEFGLTRQLARDWAIDVKSYAKDISQQVGTTQLRPEGGLAVALYDNNGYARARGLEMELTKRHSANTSGTLTYTVQWANGYASSAFEDYVRSLTNFPNPIRERRLDWDVRHQLILNGTLRATDEEPIALFGWTLPTDWHVTVLSRLSSGYPYTPGTLDPAEQQTTDNTATGPPIYSTDIKFQKRFDVAGLEAAFLVDVFNVFDQRNVQLGYGFNPWTGNPYIYGDVWYDTARGYDWYRMVQMRDPRQFSTGRYAKVGVSLRL